MDFGIKSGFKKLASKVYAVGLRVDRARARSHRLPFPVLSVGNISVGGRAKTPFVIEIVLGLKSRGFEPVVLTRGYGRKVRSPVWLEASKKGDVKDRCRADLAGDEPLEIFARTGAHVLVGKNRGLNALKFLKQNPELKKIVFVLDDGFQHWALKKDFDLLLVKAEDYTDRLLPEGRLREAPSSIWRASMILEQPRDFKKTSVLKNQAEDPSLNIVALTTRAPDPAYRDFIQEHFPLSEFLELEDHAPLDKILSALGKTEMSHVLVGAKEAVKILDWDSFFKLCSEGRITWVPPQLSPRSFELHFVECKIESFKNAELWMRIEDCLKGLERG